MSWQSTNWLYTSPILYRNNTEGTYSLNLINDEYLFKTEKSYVYKINISNIDDDIWNNTYLQFLTVGDGGYELNSYSNLNSMTIQDGSFYIWSNLKSEELKTNHLIISADKHFTTPVGLTNVKIIEVDWLVNGYSWVTDTEDPAIINNRTILENQNNVSTGWLIDFDDEKSLRWYDVDQSAFSPRNRFNIEYSRKDINYVSTFIKYPYFNISFTYSKYEDATYSDDSAAISIFLSDQEPPILNGDSILDLIEFNNYLSDSIKVSNIDIYGTHSCNFYGLDGFKHLLVVASASSASSATLIELSDIKISGSYHESNNKLYDVNVSDFSNVIDDVSYITNVGSGYNIGFIGTYSLSSIKSKIGNSLFLSGKWENGVWNNGWREDTSIEEFYDIYRSVKILSNIKWRVRISGSKDSVSKFNVGDQVSIGNIVGIDINEKRKILKGAYTIVSKSDTGINDRVGYIVVELETTFPLRRIEKDSNYHRIYITKNIWLSGAFLNGYFSGVWNYGLFKGYPRITEMYETQWIDGKFEGGHFNSEIYSTIQFSDTFNYNNNSIIAGPALGLSFSQPHNLVVGDTIMIDKDDKSINSLYDGECEVSLIIDDYKIITNKRFLSSQENESGSVSTNYRNSVIQNFHFDSINISNKTMFDTFMSSSIFSYNSWIDVNYENNSAVNIGKPQTMINKISRKSISANNLFGYPTYDILSSFSKFRDSYSLNENIYKLGSKYTLYNDYVGESSKFDKYFGPDNADIELFINQGWTFSVDSNSNATFSRPALFSNSEIKGDELKIETYNDGVVLDLNTPKDYVKDRVVDEISNNRYTLVEFDVINSSVDTEYLDNTAYYLYEQTYANKGQGTITTYFKEPILHFDNINKVDDYYELVTGNSLISGYDTIPASFLPIHENVNHLLTSNKRKFEFFYNKTNLSMNFKGGGISGASSSSVIVDNLKIIETDMIPFFKYFTDDNINTSIQVPYQGIAPYIDYSDKNFNFIDNVIIGIDSTYVVSDLNPIVINSSTNSTNEASSISSISIDDN